jgi:hypothetical protein
MNWGEGIIQPMILPYTRFQGSGEMLVEEKLRVGK